MTSESGRRLPSSLSRRFCSPWQVPNSAQSEACAPRPVLPTTVSPMPSAMLPTPTGVRRANCSWCRDGQDVNLAVGSPSLNYPKRRPYRPLATYRQAHSLNHYTIPDQSCWAKVFSSERSWSRLWARLDAEEPASSRARVARQARYCRSVKGRAGRCRQSLIPDIAMILARS